MGAILINAGRFDQVPLNQVIKSQNIIIYTVVDVLNLYSLKIFKISKINHMPRAIKTWKHNITVTAALSIQLTFP